MPYLRRKPEDDSSYTWQSLLPVTVVPLEYSWKWDTANEGPEVRLTIEAFGELSGTRADPLNQAAVMELLQQTKATLPDFNQTWINHFCSTLFDKDKDKYIAEMQSGRGMHLQSTMLVAFEFGHTRTTTKTYLSPRKLGQQGFAKLSEYMPAIQALGPSRALDAVMDFLRSNPEGGYLTPFGVSFDNVEPTSSRLKLYFASPNTSYKALREVLTLGGRISGTNFDIEKRIRAIHSLAKSLMVAPDNLPDDANISALAQPHSPNTGSAPGTPNIVDERAPLLAGFQYYFDIAPGADLPNVRFYVPIQKALVNDSAVVATLTDWMETQGHGQFCSNYVRMLEDLAGQRGLSECHGLHSFIGCLIRRDGEVDVTSYLLPG